MTTTTLILLLVTLLILVLGLILILSILSMQFYGSLHSEAPLVPVRRNALPSIVTALSLSPSSILYDLGSGDGRVLATALDREPTMRAIGLEINPWPRFLSKIKLRRYGTRAQIRNQNFFKADFSNATHIYMYLYPSIMKKLELIFDRSLRSGTRVVSCDFAFPNKTPDQIMDVPNSKALAKKLYIYTW